MKYYRRHVVQTGFSAIKRCDRPGINRRRQRECQARGSACLSLKLPEKLGDPLMGEPQHAPGITHRQVSGLNEIGCNLGTGDCRLTL